MEAPNDEMYTVTQAIIIDTDPGVDDAMAIALALAHPDIELLGLTTVFGNVSVSQGTHNALLLLEHFGVEPGAIPVAEGAAVPLVQAPQPHADFVHGADGLGNTNLASPQGQPDGRDAAQFIIDSARARPGEISLVAVGPLTNVQQAFEREPELAQWLKQLVIMGGAVDEPGNVSPVAEANFFNDPHAADAVLGAGCNTMIVGLDVTHRAMLMDTRLQRLRDCGNPMGQFLWDASRFYVNFYTTRESAVITEPGCAMHDAAAVAYLVAADAFECVSAAARVAEDGVAVGQLIINRDGYTYMVPYWENRPPVTVGMDVDGSRITELFLDTVCAYSQA